MKLEKNLIEKIDALVKKYAKKTRTLQVEFDISSLGVHYTYSSTKPNQKYHSASVGKIFAATLMLKAIEEMDVDLTTKIHTILDEEILNNLFVYKGIDYQKQVTIKHLLSHTSGVNDYFEGKLNDGSRFLDKLFENKDHFYAPQELISITRNNQNAIGKPGEKYLYTDTGFLLIGLIIEKLYKLPYNQVLEKYIFKPLKMKDTSLVWYSKSFDAKELAPLIFKGQDVHLFKALSFDFSGGGLSTTTHDLTKFLKAFFNEEIINKQSIADMRSFDHIFHAGMYYGLGMIELRFDRLFFLLKGYPRLQGGLGVSAAHAWCDYETLDTYVINMGDVKKMGSSFQLLVRVAGLIKKEKIKREDMG